MMQRLRKIGLMG